MYIRLPYSCLSFDRYEKIENYFKLICAVFFSDFIINKKSVAE